MTPPPPQYWGDMTISCTNFHTFFSWLTPRYIYICPFFIFFYYKESILFIPCVTNKNKRPRGHFTYFGNNCQNLFMVSNTKYLNLLNWNVWFALSRSRWYALETYKVRCRNVIHFFWNILDLLHHDFGAYS